MSEREEVRGEDAESTSDTERLTTADLVVDKDSSGQTEAAADDRSAVEGDVPDPNESDMEPDPAATARDAGPSAGTGDGATSEARQPLFGDEDIERFRGRWADVQAGFVDEPRRAVEDADSLVAEVMQQLAETFSSERSTLEQQWDGDGEPSTEDLRVGLQRYRSFFDRLLSA